MADNAIAPSTTPYVAPPTGGPPTLDESVKRVSAQTQPAATAAETRPELPADLPQVAATVAPTPAPTPTLSADLDIDIDSIQDAAVLRSLLAQARAMASAPTPAAPDTPPAEQPPEEPAAPLGVFEAHALRELGDGTPPELLAEFARQTAVLKRAEPYLESEDEGYAAGAQKAYREAGRELVFLKIQADQHHIQQALRSRDEPPKLPTDVSPEVVKRMVLAKLADTERLTAKANLAELPHLAGAINSGAYDPAWLAEGLDFSLPTAELNAAVDQAAIRADRQFSRTTFAAAAETTPPGARVGNPAAFTARPDEARAPIVPSGPPTMAESLARLEKSGR